MLHCYDIVLERGNFSIAFDLHVEKGTLLSLLGPSGAGKSSILQCIAGLLTPKQGRIEFNGRDITHLPPQERNACMVFQGYALFPHLSVADNIAYGLRMRKYSKSLIAKRVGSLMELLGISVLADANIYDISGGEQQRVALARALAPEPDILLLDEPLAALDRQLRLKLRQEIRSIQRASNLTVIYVTHDQEEAFAISDSIVLINKGRVEQAGSPEDLYNKPTNAFVASFLGECLLLEAEVQNHQFRTELGMISANVAAACGKRTVTLCIRPEDIVVNGSGAKNLSAKNLSAKNLGPNCFRGTVRDWQSFGSYRIAYLQSGKIIVPLRMSKYAREDIGSIIEFSIPEDAIRCVV